MYLLNIHYISGMVLGAEDQMMQQMGLQPHPDTHGPYRAYHLTFSYQDPSLCLLILLSSQNMVWGQGQMGPSGQRIKTPKHNPSSVTNRSWDINISATTPLRVYSLKPRVPFRIKLQLPTVVTFLKCILPCWLSHLCLTSPHSYWYFLGSHLL